MTKYESGKFYDVPREEAKEKAKEFTVPIEEQVQFLKSQLAETDYKAIKYAEGWIPEKEYAPVKAKRQAIRDEINRLERGMKL